MLKTLATIRLKQATYARGLLGKRRITADTALRLGRYFKMSATFWLGLQMDYDLDTAEDEIGERLDQEIVMVAVPLPITPNTRRNQQRQQKHIDNTQMANP